MAPFHRCVIHRISHPFYDAEHALVLDNLLNLIAALSDTHSLVAVSGTDMNKMPSIACSLDLRLVRVFRVRLAWLARQRSSHSQGFNSFKGVLRNASRGLKNASRG